MIRPVIKNDAAPASRPHAAAFPYLFDSRRRRRRRLCVLRNA